MPQIVVIPLQAMDWSRSTGTVNAGGNAILPGTALSARAGKNHEAGKIVLPARRRCCTAMQMCPEGRKEHQHARGGFDRLALIGKLRFTTFVNVGKVKYCR
jgi:hypothetical protein